MIGLLRIPRKLLLYLEPETCRRKGSCQEIFSCAMFGTTQQEQYELRLAPPWSGMPSVSTLRIYIRRYIAAFGPFQPCVWLQGLHRHRPRPRNHHAGEHGVQHGAIAMAAQPMQARITESRLAEGRRSRNGRDSGLRQPCAIRQKKDRNPAEPERGPPEISLRPNSEPPRHGIQWWSDMFRRCSNLTSFLGRSLLKSYDPSPESTR